MSRYSQYFGVTVYRAQFDPAPGRGHCPARAGISFQPLPALTACSLRELVADLDALAAELDASDAAIS